MDVPQQVDPFVFRLPRQDRECEIAAQLFPDVDNLCRGRTNVLRFPHDLFAIFTRLAEIDVNSMHLVTLIHQPTEDD